MYSDITYNQVKTAYDNGQTIIPSMISLETYYEEEYDIISYGTFMGVHDEVFEFHIKWGDIIFTITYESGDFIDYESTPEYNYAEAVNYQTTGYEQRYSYSSNGDDYFTWKHISGLPVLSFNGYSYYPMKNTYPNESIVNCHRPMCQLKITVTDEDETYNMYEYCEMLCATTNTTSISVWYSASMNKRVSNFMPLLIGSELAGTFNFSYNDTTYIITFPAAGIWALSAPDILWSGEGSVQVEQVDIRATYITQVSGAFVNSISKTTTSSYPEDTSKIVTPYVGTDGYIHFKITKVESTLN